ncbi:MAG TPA: STAS domain-containing protein [Roseiflexaceae bacterium]|nr:STAS domain-containing protein [Roseiflexaceae bacterium]
MSVTSERVVNHWREQGDAFVAQFADNLAARCGPAYAAMPRDTLLRTTGQIVRLWQDAIAGGDGKQLVEQGTALSQRAGDEITIDAQMCVLDVLREQLWGLLGQVFAAGDWDMDLIEQLERWLHATRTAIVGGYSQSLAEAQRQLAEREQALSDQSMLIMELSAPIVPIHEGVLVLPLVGAVDSRRASQIMEAALEQIVAYQADVLILDITGVPIVDTGVANYILQMARAVTLLGSRVVLVGIGAEIAQTIVQLGVDLRDMTTLANLQAGIAYALAQQGFAIQPTGRGAPAVLAR